MRQRLGGMWRRLDNYWLRAAGLMAVAFVRDTHFFFSAMQFHATMGCMLGTRRFSTQFIYVWIIQFNAFLMTIRRKNLAPHSALVTIYGLMLVFGFVIASYEAQRYGAFLMVNALGNFAGV